MFFRLLPRKVALRKASKEMKILLVSRKDTMKIFQGNLDRMSMLKGISLKAAFEIILRLVEL